MLHHPGVADPARFRAFPDPSDAPAALLRLEGNCGPVSAWMALKHLRKRVAAERVVRACRHSAGYGTFTVALAVGLRELGLEVEFFSEPDPDRQPAEVRCYARAEQTGVPVNAAIDLPDLLARVDDRHVAIVFYDADAETGHFSPLAGCEDERLVLPNDPAGGMEADRFEALWRAPGILRQCVLVSR